MKTKTEKLVEAIHKEFYTASSNLLIEADETIKGLKDKTPTEQDAAKAERMRKLGFSSTSLVEKVKKGEEVEKKINDHVKLMEMIVYKNTIDPVHKFITEDKVKMVCEKYGLLHGPSGNYIGDIPEKNLVEIENFKPIDEEVQVTIVIYWGNPNNKYYEESWSLSDKLHQIGYRASSPPMSWMVGGVNESRFRVPQQVYKDLNINKNNPNVTWYLETNQFSICAPQKDFNMKGMEVKEYKLTAKPVPDPVVLFEVYGGYRIVSAWGPEASDENVVNPLNN